MEIKFTVRIQKYIGLRGKGKNKRYAYKSHLQELTQKQAETYLKRTYGAYAYIGSETKSRYGIWPTLTKKFAVEVKGKKEPKIKLFSNFDKALSYVTKSVKNDVFRVNVSKCVGYSAKWARKYKYKTDTGSQI